MIIPLVNNPTTTLEPSIIFLYFVVSNLGFSFRRTDIIGDVFIISVEKFVNRDTLFIYQKLIFLPSFMNMNRFWNGNIDKISHIFLQKHQIKDWLSSSQYLVT